MKNYPLRAAWLQILTYSVIETIQANASESESKCRLLKCISIPHLNSEKIQPNFTSTKELTKYPIPHIISDEPGRLFTEKVKETCFREPRANKRKAVSRTELQPWPPDTLNTHSGISD